MAAAAQTDRPKKGLAEEFRPLGRDRGRQRKENGERKEGKFLSCRRIIIASLCDSRMDVGRIVYDSSIGHCRKGQFEHYAASLAVCGRKFANRSFVISCIVLQASVCFCPFARLLPRLSLPKHRRHSSPKSGRDSGKNINILYYVHSEAGTEDRAGCGRKIERSAGRGRSKVRQALVIAFDRPTDSESPFSYLQLSTHIQDRLESLPLFPGGRDGGTAGTGREGH